MEQIVNTPQSSMYNQHGRQQSSDQQQEPRLNYLTCNAMEKRILNRRPLNNWAVLSLKKPSLRRFLRANGQRYRARDKKDRLVQLVAGLIYRVETQIWEFRNQVRAANRLAVAPQPVQPATHTHATNPQCPGPVCTCIINISSQVLTNHHTTLPRQAITFLWEISIKRKDELDEILSTAYGTIYNATHCRLLLIKKIRDEMIREVQAQQRHLKQLLTEI